MPQLPISGVVICQDEADRIDRCLESLGFCDEIVVVDSGSSDDTVARALRHTDRVVEQPFLGYVKQKNFALGLARNDWVVCLDADEALSPELQRAILERVGPGESGVAGYTASRVTHYLGVWHDRGDWVPDTQLRVFRRSQGHWVGRDPHDRVELDGGIEPLEGSILHWNYRNFSEQIRTIDRYSTLQARARYEAGERFRWRDLLLRPPARFLRGYLLRGGFRLGLPGFVVSVSTAYYVFSKVVKLWELERRGSEVDASQAGHGMQPLEAAAGSRGSEAASGDPGQGGGRDPVANDHDLGPA